MSRHRLTKVQADVMQWLSHGWQTEPGNGMAILINGKRFCNVDTMYALQRRGFVEPIVEHGLVQIGRWKATR